MKYEYLIWDFNGTILDDTALSVQCENQIRATLGMPEISLEHYREIFCHPVAEYYKKTGFNADKAVFAKLAVAFFELYQPASLHLPLREGVRAYIIAQKEKGQKQILLSASEKENLLEHTDHFGITDLFEAILGLDDLLGASKVKLAEEWLKDTAAEKMLVIGDTIHDYEVAQALGCDCVLLSGGYNSKERLMATGAVVLDSIGELAEYVT